MHPMDIDLYHKLTGLADPEDSGYVGETEKRIF